MGHGAMFIQKKKGDMEADQKPWIVSQGLLPMGSMKWSGYHICLQLDFCANLSDTTSINIRPEDVDAHVYMRPPRL